MPNCSSCKECFSNVQPRLPLVQLEIWCQMPWFMKHSTGASVVPRRGYIFVLLFLGQHRNCISSWHKLEHPRSFVYFTSAGTVPCAFFSNIPCSNSSPSPTTASAAVLNLYCLRILLWQEDPSLVIGHSSSTEDKESGVRVWPFRYGYMLYFK